MRTKKALYNILSQMLYEIVAMVCGLVLPRFILAAFGSSYNGMVASITQFLDYISFLTLGISGATRVAIYKANAENNPRKVSGIIKATERYMHKVGYAFIAYLFVLAIIFPLLVKEEYSWLSVSSLVIIIGLGTFAEYFFGITYKTYLMANQSMYIYNVIQVCSKIANTLLSIFLIRLNQSIQIVKLGSAFCFVLTPIILNYIVRKKYNIISDVEPDDSALKQRTDVMAHSIANSIHQYTDIFLLTLFSSQAIVSVYSVYNLVLLSLRKLQNVFTTGLEAAFGELWAKGEIKKFTSNFCLFEYLTFSFVSIVFSCTGCLILPFVSLYTKGVNDINYVIPLYAAVSVLTEGVFCIRSPYLIAVQAAGKYKETKMDAFIEAGINFGVSCIAVFKLGLIGVMIGTLSANAFRTIRYAFFLSKEIVNRPVKKFICLCIWTAFNSSIIITAYNCWVSIEIVNWLSWLMAGFAVLLISVSVVVVTSIVFYRSSLLQSIGVAHRMLTRRRK